MKTRIVVGMLLVSALTSSLALAGGKKDTISITVRNCFGETASAKSKLKNGLGEQEDKDIAHNTSQTISCKAGDTGKCRFAVFAPSCGAGVEDGSGNFHVGNGAVVVIYATGNINETVVNNSTRRYPEVGYTTNAPNSCAGYTPRSCSEFR
ncbi:MAG: hypothetical protein ACFCBW_04675 [Candidatus Competibacterales bacterium]